MANQILETLNKRSSEIAERGQQVFTTAYQRGLDVVGIDEDEVRDRFDQLKGRRQELETRIQKTLGEQVRELQNIEVRVIGRLEEAVGSFRDMVSNNFNRFSESLDKLEKRLQEVEKDLSTRIHQLPIENYDRLNADEIVKQIDSLAEDALAAVRAYEAQHKGRVTVLKAIDSRLPA